MARQVLPIVGAIVGAYFGNPQLGYAIGSIIGNAVDPLHVAGPRLQEFPVMGTTEGNYRAVVYGTCVVRNCQLLDWGPLDDVTVEERQGKGGGPVLETQRLYQTYAFAIGEPVQAIRYIKRNGVMVYDVRPGSAILAESAKFAERFRFYNGSESQLPDPDLEALPHNGVGNTPAYRGTSLVVVIRDDLTDSRGVIPTYEVEVVQANAAEFSEVALVTDTRHYFGGRTELDVAGADIGWAAAVNVVRVSPNGRYAAGSIVAQLGIADRFTLRKFDPEAETWTLLAPPAVMPTYGPSMMAWSPDGAYLAVSTLDIGSQAVMVYRLDGDVLTKLADPVSTIPNNGTSALCWDSVGSRLAVGNAASANGFYVFDFINEALVNRRALAPPGTTGVGGAPTRMAFQQGAGSRYLACSNASWTFIVRLDVDPMTIEVVLTTPHVAGIYWHRTGSYLVGVDNTTVRVLLFDDSVIGSPTLTIDSTAATPLPAGAADTAIDSAGEYLAVATGEQYPSIYSLAGPLPPVATALTNPVASGAAIASVSWSASPSLAQYESAGIVLEDLVADICDRCGIPAGKLDFSELVDEVRGCTLGGPYDGAGSIVSMMPAFLFDLAQPEKTLTAVMRGGAVIETITEDRFVDLPDENVLRGQDIEYPRQLLLKYLDPEQDYAAPAAPVARRSPDIRVRGEMNMELPVALTRTEAVRAADRMLKVAWEDLNGEISFSLPIGPFAWLSPTDLLGLSLRSGVYRVRVSKVEESAGVLSITARRDRQSAYTSNLTPMPLPPPSGPPATLPGDTVAVLMNLPALTDQSDLLGITIALSGRPGYAWRGANLAYSVDNGANWVDLGNITRRAVIGTLQAALPASAEWYTDATNPLQVQLVGNDELEALTQVQFLSEGNPAAIVFPDGTAELVQFRDVQDDGNRDWTLTILQRGRLATTPGPHLAGARFVMLAGSTFVQLPAALMGAALKFRVTSLGRSPEEGDVYDFTWDPIVSQTEFPAALLELERAGGTIEGTWSPRHRLGSDVIPVASLNFTGWRVTLDDGTTSETFEVAPTTTPSFSRSDAAFTGDIDVTVEQLNRFTDAGPEIMETI